MTDIAPNEGEDLFQLSYDHGFDLGQSDEMKKLVAGGVTALQMAHAVHIAGAIHGLATVLADLMGEANAHYALHQAAIVVTVHCEHKNDVANAN